MNKDLPSYSFGGDKVMQAPVQTKNPWQVDSLEAFLTLKCPECEFLTDVETLFQAHAIENHPLSSALYNKTVFHPGKIRQEYKDKFISKLTSSHNGSKKVLIEVDETGKVKEFYQCTACDSKFKSLAGVTFHIATVHEGLKPFICSTCNYNAKKVSALNKHIEQVHEEIKKKECEYCYKRFGTKGSLKRHIDKLHQGNLKQHIVKVHKPKEPAECLICNPKKIFPTDKQLVRHHKTVHEKKKPYGCPTCGHAFRDKNDLLKHIKRIHERVKKPVSCYDCGANFNHVGSLKKHLAAKGKKTRAQIEMEKEEANEAEDLEYTLEDLLDDRPPPRTYLKNQPGTVHEGKKHICPICGIGVTSPTYLKNHIASVH